jgi:archaellum component FlaC
MRLGGDAPVKGGGQKSDALMVLLEEMREDIKEMRSDMKEVKKDVSDLKERVSATAARLDAVEKDVSMHKRISYGSAVGVIISLITGKMGG